MIEAKVTEWMLKVQAHDASIRFWFNAEKISIEAAFDSATLFVNVLKVEQSFFLGRDGMEFAARLVRELFYEEDALAACEILDSHGNGVVLYFEWP